MSTVILPMESNPDVMSKYLYKLGVSDTWKMVDVMGLDSDALSWVPRPVLAVVLLFPLTNSYEIHRQEEETELTKKGETPPPNVFHLKQVVSNVCGTIALVHSVANNMQNIEIREDGLLKQYLDNAKGLDPSARGSLLESSKAILEAYKDIISSGNEEANEEEQVNNHFVTFIHKDGNLYELDGRKSFPIKHGLTTPETLLEDAAKVCKEFIEREPGNIGFTVVALVPV